MAPQSLIRVVDNWGAFEGKYRQASVLHDVACDRKIEPWEQVHEMFYWAMLASGVSSLKAKIMYAAVYHKGPRWPFGVVISNLPPNQSPSLAKGRWKKLLQAARLRL